MGVSVSVCLYDITFPFTGMIGRDYGDMEITSPLNSFLLDQHSKRFEENKPSPPFTLIIYLIDVQNRLLAVNNEKTL